MGLFDKLKIENATAGENIAQRASQVIRSVIPKVSKETSSLYLASGSGPKFNRRELYMCTGKPKFTNRELYFGRKKPR